MRMLLLRESPGTDNRRFLREERGILVLSFLFFLLAFFVLCVFVFVCFLAGMLEEKIWVSNSEITRAQKNMV